MTKLQDIAIGVLNGEKTFEEAVDELAVETTARDGFSTFVSTMEEGYKEGLTMEEALAQFREVIVSDFEDEDPPPTDFERALLLRTFERSVELWNTYVKMARQVVEFADRPKVENVSSDDMPDPENSSV